MITIGPACAGQPTRDRHEASYHRSARSLGNREVRRQHPGRTARCGDFDGCAGPPPPDRRDDGRDCDSRRNRVAGAAARPPCSCGIGRRRWGRGSRWPSWPHTSWSPCSRSRAPRSRWPQACCSARCVGVPIAVVASTVSALLALLLVRAAGWQLNRLVRHPRVESLDDRLRQRGWPSVVSMRLIPAVPFSVLNYAAGASAVRVLPYTLADAGRPVARHRRGGHPRRRAHRQRQPAAVPGVAVHRERRCRRSGLRDPHASPPPPRARR